MATYDEAWKDMSSRKFCNFVDLAISFFEEEQSHRRLDLDENGKSNSYTMNLSEEYKFLYQFPRKPRPLVIKSVTRTRNPRQNLYVASSSSSSLIPDLNTLPTDPETEEPQIRRQWGSLFLGDYKKITENPQNPNSNTAESEKTEIEDPPNPNSDPSPSSCLIEKTSRKRLAVEQRTRTGGFKKAKLDPFSSPSSSSSSCVTDGKTRAVKQSESKKAKVESLSWKGRDLPELLLRVMRNMNVAEEPKLIFEREKLFATDVAPGQGRLSMPFNQLIRHDFLTPVEERILQKYIINGNKTGLEALLLNQRSEKWEVRLKRWETNGRSWNYCLVSGWNDFVKSNSLQKDDGISVWSFRSSGLPCFALIPLPTVAQSSSD